MVARIQVNDILHGKLSLSVKSITDIQAYTRNVLKEAKTKMIIAKSKQNRGLSDTILFLTETVDEVKEKIKQLEQVDRKC